MTETASAVLLGWGLLALLVVAAYGFVKAFMSGADVIDRGITYRQLNHWTTQGYLKPLDILGGKTAGTGNARIYDAAAVEKARILKLLLDRSTAVAIADGLSSGERVVTIGNLTIHLRDEREDAR